MPTSSRAGAVHLHARLNGEMLHHYPITLSHSTDQGGSVRLRDDVGIVPYNHDQVHSIQRTKAVPYIL